MFCAAMILITGTPGAMGQDKPADPPTAATLLARHVAARGGAAAWEEVTSLSRHQQTAVTVSTTWRRGKDGRPDQYRIAQESTEFEHWDARGYDGARAWLASSIETRPLSAEELQVVREDVAVPVELLAAKALGLKLQVIGPDTVQGKPVWKVSTKFPSGRVVMMFFDMKTWLEVARSRTAWSPDGEAVDVWTIFADYRPVNNILLPHSINGSTTSYAINTPLPDRFFSK
jgi:hypothetical protein